VNPKLFGKFKLGATKLSSDSSEDQSASTSRHQNVQAANIWVSRVLGSRTSIVFKMASNSWAIVLASPFNAVYSRLLIIKQFLVKKKGTLVVTRDTI
jgi:hypothetical protein